MTQSPTLIYLALESWFSSTRLPKFLRAAGFNTIALCPPGSLLAQSRHLDDRILAPLDAIPGALDAAHATHRPALIVPADEAAIQLLHRLARTLDDTAPLRRTIARSLGEPACRGETLSKQQINGHAARAGIRVPRQAVCDTPDQALDFCRTVGYPIVLKKDDTYGGFGVRLCRDDRALLANWYWLQAEDRRGRIAAHVGGAIARYIRPLRDHLSARPGPALIAQSFVSGQLAFRSFVADRGAVLAGITAVADMVDPPPFGASSVVRFGEHPAISRATRDLARALGLSGFGAIDFILDPATGEPSLLELNPRVTPICHLGQRLGVDLCAALFAAATGSAAPAPPPVADAMIALFPNELRRDSASPYLRTGFHDMPADDPDVLASWLASLPREQATLRVAVTDRIKTLSA